MQTSAHAARRPTPLPLARHALLAMEVDTPLHGQQLTAFYLRRPYDMRRSLVFVDTDRLVLRQLFPDVEPSVSYQHPGQPLEAPAVQIPVGSTDGWPRTLNVELYTPGIGITLAREGDDVVRGEGSLEFERHGIRVVVDPLNARKADWLVAPIESHVAAVRLQIEAVDQKELAKLGHSVWHGTAPAKTAILCAPAGFGKSTIAHAMAAFIGCTHVVEEWNPATPAVLGALHLTNSKLPVQWSTGAAPAQPAYTADSADTELEILQRAEGFMLGFEGDATHPGVDDQLVNLRYLIEQRRAKKGAGLLLELARRVARLNANAGEIGAGMLASLVIDAQNALTASGERQ